MNAPGPHAPPTVPPRRGLGWLVALLLVLLLAWSGWRWWEARGMERDAMAGQVERVAALETRVDALRRDQRANAARVQQAEATNRLLREELLGLGQRAALLEDSLSELEQGGAGALRALRLDEATLLLSSAADRLAAGDMDGARRAYAIAANVLDRLDDPALVDLRQALAQERAVLDAAGPDPRVAVRERLEAFAASLGDLPVQASRDVPASAPWWRRLAARVVDVRPSGDDQVVAPSARSAGLAALQLELALARAALERRDEAAFAQSVDRLDGGLKRLWPPSPARQAARDTLRGLRGAPLRLAMPELGSTLAQLERLRRD